GTFTAAVSYNVGINPYAVAVGDLDGDSALDLVVANFSSNTVSVLRNHGDGTFAAAVSYAVGINPPSGVVVDGDGDRTLDLAVASSSSNTVSVLKNDGVWPAAPAGGGHVPGIERPVVSSVGTPRAAGAHAPTNQRVTVEVPQPSWGTSPEMRPRHAR